MSPAALAAGGLPEFPILQTPLGLQCHLKSRNSRKLRKLTNNFLSETAFDASASEASGVDQR